MSIEFVSGDLFANTHAAAALAHGCNCQGSMGAGIAKGFRDRYPAMYEQFRAKCKAIPREFNLGDAWLWKNEGQPWVFNLGTQEGIWRARASYEAIETALNRMKQLADDEGIDRIAIPRIGVGYGGLSWKKVRTIVERAFADWAGRLIVYETFVPQEEAKVTTPGAATSAPRKRTQSKKALVSPALRLRALTIACTDLERSVHFYETVLGAMVIPNDVGTNRWYRLGSIDITLLPNATENSPATFPTHAMTMLWLEVDDLSLAIKHFSAHGVPVIDEGDGQFMMVTDPDGLVIEVWESERE
jgi:O-acetyl-ADP-ribose deacetylase (regulator of RNase III)/catechol 2,3-dioxygenase-like lactoylglutathione lyase family enzyme